ncbi:pyridoxal-phosphate-dependent aminotransferase family protein [Litoribacillus peritrichatus]
MSSEILPPKEIALSNLLPSEPLLLMGAGPVPIPHAVAQANGVVINHLGDTMDQVIQRVKLMSQYAFQTRSDKIIGVAGPSSAAMEMAITNVLWPGKRVLVIDMGTFSNRFGEMAEGIGAEVDYLSAKSRPDHESATKPPHAITLEGVQRALAEKQYDVVTMAQGETSCGMFNSILPEIAATAKEHGALVIVDAVCTLSTMPLKMDAWNLDIVVTGGQKGLSSIPGVSVLAFSETAWNIIETRENKCPHWCLDATRAQKFWGHQQYHYTAPVPGILALHEALRLICTETLENRFERHELSSKALQAGIEAMGLSLFVKEEHRLNSVVAINLPEGADSAAIRNYMVERFNVEISGAFGLNIIRIGQMGEQCRSHNLFKVLYALGMSFKKNGFEVDIAQGMAALETNLVRDLDHFVD